MVVVVVVERRQVVGLSACREDTGSAERSRPLTSRTSRSHSHPQATHTHTPPHTHGIGSTLTPPPHTHTQSIHTGAAVGRLVFSAAEAEEWKARGERVILCRHETSPEDVGGMHAAEGIVTCRGGMTSHAAVVARGWGKPCVCGCEHLHIDLKTKVRGRQEAD